jgi:hypothetical protein
MAINTLRARAPSLATAADIGTLAKRSPIADHVQRRREVVSAERSENCRIERGIPRQPFFEVVAKPVAAVKLVEHLEDDTRAETPDRPDSTLPTQSDESRSGCGVRADRGIGSPLLSKSDTSPVGAAPRRRAPSFEHGSCGRVA